MPQSAQDIVTGILNCYQTAQHCLVDAVLIEDKNQRIDAALKCLTANAECVSKIKGAREIQSEIDKLKKHRQGRAGERARR
jgi:hypothetical protein